MPFTSEFWSRYLHFQRPTVGAFAVLELCVWAYGAAFSWRPIFWDPLTIIEYAQTRWPPLALSGVYLVLVWIVGASAERLHVSAVAAWLATAIPAFVFVGYLIWAMYESTT